MVMTTPDLLINCLKSLLALTGLWCLFFWLYRDFRLDVFRQELFALRDQLFDLALTPSLDFNHPAYGTLRRTINGFIRFGHDLTLSRVLFLLFFEDRRRIKTDDSFEDRWGRVVTNLPTPVLHEMEEIVRSMHKVVIKHLVLSSPLLVVCMAGLVIPTRFGIVGWFHMDRWIRRFDRPLERIDSIAVAYGA